MTHTRSYYPPVLTSTVLAIKRFDCRLDHQGPTDRVFWFRIVLRAKKTGRIEKAATSVFGEPGDGGIDLIRLVGKLSDIILSQALQMRLIEVRN